MDNPLIGYLQKFKSGEIVVEYVPYEGFEYTVEDIQQDFLKNGTSTIAAVIQKKKNMGGCQCTIKNPKGI